MDDAGEERTPGRHPPPVPTPPVPPRVTRPIDRRGAQAAGISDWQLRHRAVRRSSREHVPAPGRLLGPPATSSRGAAGRTSRSARQPRRPPHRSTVCRSLSPRATCESTSPCRRPPASGTGRDRQDPCVRECRRRRSSSRAGVALTSPGADLAGPRGRSSRPAPCSRVADQTTGRRCPRAGLRPRPRVRAPRGPGGSARRAPCSPSRHPLAAGPRWSRCSAGCIHEAGLPAPVLQHVVRDGDRPASSAEVRPRHWPDRRACSWSSTATCTGSGESSCDGPPEAERPGRCAGWTVLPLHLGATVLGRPDVTPIRLGPVTCRSHANSGHHADRHES